MHRYFTGPLTIEEVAVSLADLPAELEGIKLVQLSDLHFDGRCLSEQLLAQAIDIANAAKPDLVVLTGDYVTNDPSPIHQLTGWLKRLASRRGTFAVLGNHDLYHRNSRSVITQALTAIGIEVLWNRVAYPLGPGLAVVGLADLWSRKFNPALVLGELDPGVPRLVLAHNPDSAISLQEWRVDLQLSGHTHGGQVVLPGLGTVSRWVDPVRACLPKKVRRIVPFMGKSQQVVRHWEWSQGLHHLGDRYLYVNRGLGTYRPGRLFCPPEVTVITLVRRNGPLDQAPETQNTLAGHQLCC